MNGRNGAREKLTQTMSRLSNQERYDAQKSPAG